MTTLATHRPASLRSAVTYLTSFQGYMALWFWPFPLVGIAIAITAVNRFGTIESSLWDSASYAPRWFLFSMGITVVAGFFTTWVAHGRTRTSMGVAAGVSMALTAVLYAAFYTLVLRLEHWLYSAQGWPTAVQHPHLYSSGDQIGPVFLESLLVMLGHGFAGLLVVAAYFRLGGWWGTIALPVTLLPILVTEVVMYLGWDGAAVLSWLPLDAGVLSAPAAAALVLGTCALTALSVVALLRGTALTARPS